MTALLSSPMMSTLGSGRNLVAKANNSRYDAFEQPNSPTLKHDDLPDEFADQSFGSSMSLGSSFELSKLAASGAVIGGGDLKNADPAFRAVRHSPTGKQHEGLGAAMGTILNSKSPGLAAKMNTSPQYMDLSPIPTSVVVVKAAHTARNATTQGTPLKTTNTAGEENLPPGSAMKEDTSNHAIETTLQRRHYSDFSGITQGGSLGRLFGTEISMHGNAKFSGTSAARASLGCVFGGHDLPVDALTGFGDESLSSPDKEPPAKRRPASLPVSQNPFQRPSLRSAGMGPPQQITATTTQSANVSSSITSTSRPRPNLLKSMTTGHTNADEGKKRIDAKRASVEALRQNYRASDSIVPTMAGVRQARSRAGSTDRAGTSLFASMGEQRFGQKSSLPPPSHATIIESPSPTDRAERNGMADYFFDPQSPEVQKASPSDVGQSSSRSTASASVLPPPPSIASVMTGARPNTLTKAVSAAAVPLHTASSMLGKRANPYAARKAGAALAASAAPEVQTTSGVGASSRLKVPAPRRCQSALDNSAAFQLAGASLLSGTGRSDDMSMSSMDASGSAAADCSIEDASPSVMRNVVRQHATISASTMIRLPPGFDASGSPIAPSSRSSSRPGLFRRPSKDDSSPLGYGKRFAAGKVTAASIDTIEERPSGSPYGGASTGQYLLPNAIGAPDCAENHMPGFGASEREGKILPCFNVKDDGLMRITPETLRDMLSGKFDESMDGFQIVDCRFGYEFDGGHIPGAVNLSTLEKVKRHFLQPVNATRLPPRSQSGRADAHGKMRKKVIIFHCEFSVKRAPSSALALRQADRALAHDYPNCHYPEVYVLQGGYCGFYKLFSDVCQPKAYVQMDDPKYVHKRSVELNGFRKQFSRHKSFAYGDNVGGRQTQSDGQVVTRADRVAAAAAAATSSAKDHRLPSALARTIKEEDDSASFDNSISSPSAVQADAVLARRRGLARHATSASILGPGPSNNGLRSAIVGHQQQNVGLASQQRTTKDASPPPPSANSLGFKPILNKRDDSRPDPTCIGDLSFGSSCSIADDTSFDVSVSAIAESPCAAVNGGQGARKTYSRLAPGPR